MAGNTDEAVAQVQAEAASAFVNAAYEPDTVNKLAIRHEQRQSSTDNWCRRLSGQCHRTSLRKRGVSRCWNAQER